MAKRTYVSFDWAIKKLLRDKANFAILEGFLTELLLFEVKIQEILESEANKENALDKFDRVDILVKSEKGELMLIEVQYGKEQDYFHRMVYGISKLISQYIQEGQPYGEIKKAYSINIVYFGLGQGTDYLYEYRGEFFGMNSNEVLLPTQEQKTKFDVEKISDIFPKYYIIRVDNFQKEIIQKPIDEWIYFLQNSEIQQEFQSRGMSEARKKLAYEKLPDVQQQIYNRFVENRRIEMAVLETATEDGIKIGFEKGLEKTAKNMKQEGFDSEVISKVTGLSKEEIEKL